MRHFHLDFGALGIRIGVCGFELEISRCFGESDIDAFSCLARGTTETSHRRLYVDVVWEVELGS